MGRALRKRTSDRNDNPYPNGPENTQQMAKCKGTYGKQEGYINVGVFRRSEISDILFIIYLGDMMDAYDALNINERTPLKT